MHFAGTAGPCEVGRTAEHNEYLKLADGLEGLDAPGPAVGQQGSQALASALHDLLHRPYLSSVKSPAMGQVLFRLRSHPGLLRCKHLCATADMTSYDKRECISWRQPSGVLKADLALYDASDACCLLLCHTTSSAGPVLRSPLSLLILLLLTVMCIAHVATCGSRGPHFKTRSQPNPDRPPQTTAHDSTGSAVRSACCASTSFGVLFAAVDCPSFFGKAAVLARLPTAAIAHYRKGHEGLQKFLLSP